VFSRYAYSQLRRLVAFEVWVIATKEDALQAVGISEHVTGDALSLQLQEIE